MKKIITIICLAGSLAVAGDLTTDNLTVLKDAAFYGEIKYGANTASPTNGMVLYFNFDTYQGGIVSDQSGNNNAGTVYGATWIASGKHNGAYFFDGTNDYILVNDSDSLDVANITISMWHWYDISLAEGMDMLATKGPHDECWEVMNFDNAKILLRGGDPAGILTDDRFSTGVWHHIVCVISNTTGSVYIDGSLVKSGPVTAVPVTSGDLLVGASLRGESPNDFLHGYMDELRIYNRALSSGEIMNLFTQCASGLNPGSISAVSITSSNGVTQTSSSTTNTFMGNVGIGTNIPSAKLHVAGDLKVEGSLTVKSNLVVGAASTASGQYAVAEGRSYANGAYSHAEGYGSWTTDESAHAEGMYGYAFGEASHAEGNCGYASGPASHAEGRDTTASGWAAHAEGRETVSSSDGSHAEGYGSSANGWASHAEGYCTIAGGDFSHASGIKAAASNYTSYVWSSSDYDGEYVFGSTMDRQFNIFAHNGIRLMGGHSVLIDGDLIITNGTIKASLLPSGDIPMGVYTNK